MTPTISTSECQELRRRCPGPRSVTIGILVPIVLGLVGLAVGSHSMLASQITQSRQAAAATETELRIRVESIKANGAKLDEALRRLEHIQAQLDAGNTAR